MASSSRAELTGRVIAGRFRLIALLGRGASARVYLAEDTTLRRRVAVKVMHDEMADDAGFVKRFGAEAQAAAALNHPNIMHIYDSGTEDGVPYLVCEYLGGGSLRAMVERSRLSPSQALLVGLEVARGLDYAHQQGFVHRDIKPANLLFGEDGRLRIADFGLARAIAEAAWTEPQGMLLGTVRYAAPEQARGQAVDGRADVYSLALVLIEAVTGVVPFVSDSTTATLMARCDGDIPVPAELGQLRSVLQRAGRLDPAERADAGELEISFLAAAEDMERPEPLVLAGALAMEPLVDESADATRVGRGEPVTSEAVRDQADSSDDFTIVLPAPVPEVLDPEPDPPLEGESSLVSDPVAQPTMATRTSTVDIPLDSVPVPVVRSGTPSTPPSNLDSTDGPTGEPSGRRRRWLIPLVAVALIAAATGGWWLLRTPSAVVPNVRGLSIEKATAALKAKGWTVTTVLSRRDNTSANEVISQSPRAGAELDTGSRVRLGVSLGNTLVPVPGLAGLDEAAATAALTGVGLSVGDVARPNDENAAAGIVMSAQPAVAADANGQVPKGTRINLTISAGPAPRTIPTGLGGQQVSVAKDQLGALGLSVSVTETYNDAAVGTVLALDPVENTQVAKGSTVKVTVSKGPEPKPIPNVVGMSATDATTTLAASGFTVSRVDGSPLKKVLLTDPAAGGSYPAGTAVRLVTKS